MFAWATALRRGKVLLDLVDEVLVETDQRTHVAGIHERWPNLGFREHGV